MAGFYAFHTAHFFKAGSVFELSEAESQHLTKALRAKPGDAITVLNGQGSLIRCTLESIGKRAKLKVSEVKEVKKTTPLITLALALPKGKTLENTLRKATEIGVSNIQLLTSAHCENKLEGSRWNQKREKLLHTLTEACKQSGNPFLPSLSENILGLKDLLAKTPSSEHVHFIASLEQGAAPLTYHLNKRPTTPTSVTWLIGPEGDFSTEEYAQINNAGYLPVRLASNVLRVETAATYALSITDQHFQKPRD